MTCYARCSEKRAIQRTCSRLNLVKKAQKIQKTILEKKLRKMTSIESSLLHIDFGTGLPGGFAINEALDRAIF